MVNDNRTPRTLSQEILSSREPPLLKGSHASARMASVGIGLAQKSPGQKRPGQKLAFTSAARQKTADPVNRFSRSSLFQKGATVMSNRLLSSAFAAALAFGAFGASASDLSSNNTSADSVSGIHLATLPGMSLEKGAEVHIQTQKKPRYHMFRLSNPTRLVLDIRGADVASAILPTEFGSHDLVSAVTATQFQGPDGKISRVVVVLRADAEFQPLAKDDGIHITLVNKNQTATAKSVSPVASANTGMIELTGEGNTPKASVLKSVGGVDQQGASLVQLKTNGEVARYEVEEIDNPPRLVVDLYGIDGPKALNRPLSLPGLKRIRAAAHRGYTRIVVEGTGKNLPAYDIASTSEGIQLVFADPNEVRIKKTGVQVSALNHVNKNGFERVSLNISDSVAVRTIANAPGKKTVALDGVKLSSSLLGSHSFKGNVAYSMDVVADANNPEAVRITLHTPVGAEHSVWQKDGKLLWDVRASAKQASSGRVQPRAAPYAHTIAATAREGTSARRYRGRKITLDLMDAEVINVLRLLGDVSGKNIVVGDDIKGKVSIKLKNVPWDQALDVILRTKGFDKEVKGGIIRIATADKLAKERQARLDLAAKLLVSEPTSVRLIPVNYGVAEELVPQIKELLSGRGKVTHDSRTNVIIVEDIRENLDQAQQLVRTLDTKTPQVLIEARMIEAQTTFSRQLGIQWGGNLTFAGANGNPTGLVFPSSVHTAGGLSPNTGAISPNNLGVLNELQPNFAINMPAADSTSALGMTLGSVGDIGLLNARISAAEVSGELKIVSAPKVTTLNNKTAVISQGIESQFPIVTPLTGLITFQQVKADLRLNVTPHVTADGAILMAVDVSNNSLAANSIPGQPPNIITKESKTELLVQDGDTAVIGGVFTRTTRDGVKQTPLLGDIPLLGWLFKSKSELDERNEMLIFITPRIVTQDNSF
ncbi:MAG: type IV pilus secretin PilQ [Deltaproteobacteria bacterium]|nr:type IV pilus secretin PilQ [Deltaproteobacteria bacterium]